MTGRERHVAAAREDNLPYPHRALRTPDFHYIRNFMPDRWPMGSPKAVTAAFAPPVDELEHNTFVAFPDMDASPTKAWLIGQRNESQWKWHHNYAFGKRPAEELYDLRQDPDQTKNVAADPAHADVRQELAASLVKIRTAAGDPRVTGDGGTFDRPPYSSEPEAPKARPPKPKKPVPSR